MPQLQTSENQWLLRQATIQAQARACLRDQSLQQGEPCSMGGTPAPLDEGFHATFVRPRNRAQGTKRSCMYTHVHAHVHTCTCAHAHICILTYAVPKHVYVTTLICINTPIILCSYAHLCVIMCPRLYNTQMQQCWYTYIHIFVYIYVPTYVIPSYVHTCSQIHIHMHTYHFVIPQYSCMYMHAHCYMNICVC